MRNLLFFLLASLFMINNSFSQDPIRFQKGIDAFKEADNTVDYTNVLLFTGSSSIRMWKSLGDDFPDHNVINRGFGGSQFTDLTYYADQLILQYLPQKIFIYEGDNDIAAGKSVETIMKDALYLASKIRRTLPNSTIYLISAKPSIARWDLKDQYLQLNRQFLDWSMSDDKIEYIDVWTPMCDKNGNVFEDIFIQDNLHMNAKGYAIWKKTFAPFISE